MKNEPMVPASDHTEALLQNLIAECHQIIRDVVVPSAQSVTDDDERRRYLESAIALVRIAAAAGDTVARLRGGVTQETRQRITVERIEKSGGQALPGGRGV